MLIGSKPDWNAYTNPEHTDRWREQLLMAMSQVDPMTTVAPMPLALLANILARLDALEAAVANAPTAAPAAVSPVGVPTAAKPARPATDATPGQTLPPLPTFTRGPKP